MTDRIHLGRFVKAFGIRGELKLYASDDFWLEAFDSEELFIARESDPENERSVVLEYGKPHGGQYVVKLEGVDDRNDAEELVGEDLFLDGTKIDVPLPERERPHQAIGMTVRTDEGRVIGTGDECDVRPAAERVRNNERRRQSCLDPGCAGLRGVARRREARDRDSGHPGPDRRVTRCASTS